MTRKLLVTIDCNRVTCGKCEHLTKEPCGRDMMWLCRLFGGEAHLGWVGAMKTPNRAQVCLDAEAEARG